MLELDQILRANEINFAILAALPAFFLSLGMLTLIRTWLKQVRRIDNSRQTKCDSDTYMCSSVFIHMSETRCAQSMMQL